MNREEGQNLMMTLTTKSLRTQNLFCVILEKSLLLNFFSSESQMHCMYKDFVDSRYDVTSDHSGIWSQPGKAVPGGHLPTGHIGQLFIFIFIFITPCIWQDASVRALVGKDV